jgi:hypothetical protein
MAESEYTIQDMLKTVHDGSPTKFADYFSGVMVDKVNDRVDQIRQKVAAVISGQDLESEMDSDDEEELDASAEEDETELDDEEQFDGEETEGTDRED